jgi:filamentous hemagglutinin
MTGCLLPVGYINTKTVKSGQANNFEGYAGGGTALYGGLGRYYGIAR